MSLGGDVARAGGAAGSRGARETPTESDGRLLALIDAAPFGAHLYELRPDGRLEFVAGNESANRILGVDCTQFIGMTIEEAFPPLADTPVPEAYRATARDGVPYHDDQVVYEAEGIAGIYDVYAMQLGPGQVAAFFQDVTERRRAEKERAALEEQLHQAQKMEAIGALAGGIAHDFNNLLTAITGFAELLRTTFDPDDPRIDDVDQIRKASAGAAGLIRQLLAFSRQEVVRPAAVDLAESVRDAERILRRVLGEHIALVTRLAPDLDTVFADETHLIQVVLNLAVNARDAMPAGGTLTIEAANVDVDQAHAERHPPLTPGRHVALTMSDTGVGMDDATTLRVFEPFFTTKEAGQGTGMGLATVYGIAKQSGGAVWVGSEKGVGSTFTILLPSHGRARPRRIETGDQMAHSRLTGTVLVAEDAADVRTFVTRVLQALGHRVLAAEDGPSALGIFDAEAGSIDVLLTDVVMPGMSGRELARIARTLNPSLRVVYMSGYATTVLSEEEMAAADFRLLTKPFTTEDLEGFIEEALTRPA